MKKYRTSGYDIKIRTVEILRETLKCVIIETEDWKGKKKEKRELKKSWHYEYHDTWEKAHEYLLEEAKNKVAKAQKNLALYLNQYRKVEAMRPEGG